MMKGMGRRREYSKPRVRIPSPTNMPRFRGWSGHLWVRFKQMTRLPKTNLYYAPVSLIFTLCLFMLADRDCWFSSPVWLANSSMGSRKAHCSIIEFISHLWFGSESTGSHNLFGLSTDIPAHCHWLAWDQRALFSDESLLIVNLLYIVYLHHSKGGIPKWMRKNG